MIPAAAAAAAVAQGLLRGVGARSPLSCPLPAARCCPVPTTWNACLTATLFDATWIVGSEPYIWHNGALQITIIIIIIIIGYYVTL